QPHFLPAVSPSPPFVSRQKINCMRGLYGLTMQFKCMNNGQLWRLFPLKFVAGKKRKKCPVTCAD
ncbi:hypothetical protein, partial [Mesorhizobium sp.]|uniref:hypothetical protein n=1 Tax=Mesorhizobium sp. TaxID=1871066 RepID=UPI0032AF751C